MTTENQIPIRVYKIGPWPQKEPLPNFDTQLSQRAIKWLGGASWEDCPMDERLSNLLQEEFKAQETYRNTITSYLLNIRRQVEQRQLDLQDSEGQPNSPETAWQYGYSCGRREMLRECAQLIQDVINEAMFATQNQGIPK